jgi:hypothetical protein
MTQSGIARRLNKFSRVPIGGARIGANEPNPFASLPFKAYVPIGGIVITQAP